MSCSCTGNCDLISINPLVLSDTFHTWFDRTNEVIESVSNVNIYDIEVGITNGGLTSSTGCVNGNYNGVVTIKVQPGPGIGVGTTLTPNYYLNHTMIDVSGMTAYGSTGFESYNATAFPAVDDWFIFSDASDSSLGSGNGTPKKIKAQQILPPTVYLPAGFQFNGNVSINGNLSVQGVQSVIDSNNVLIEDKAIEVAYRRFVQIDVTGPTSGTLPNTFPKAGMTFNYFDAGVGSTANPTTIGQISEVAFRGAITTLKLHNFTVGGVNDIAPLGRLSITGAIFDFTMNAGPTTSNAFFTDDELDEAGLIVKGASGDKALLWVYKEGPAQDTYNAFVSTTNLGVSGSSNAIIASKFRSYGYSDSAANNTFQFMGYNTGKPKIILGGATGTVNGYAQYGYWSIQHDNGGGTSTQQPLVWSFKQFASGTETTEFTIYSGPSGPTYPTTNVTGQSNNRVGNFAAGLNVDFLDGAHGTTMPTAWSIPVALTDGTIAEDWISPKSMKAITRCFTQASHGLVVGDVVRINPNTGGLTYALATSREYAEVLGVVSSVVGNEVCVVSKGYVSGLTGTASSNIYDILPLVTGNVYFLSPNDGGAMIADPDGGMYPIGLGEVRKPVMMAINSNTGYVVNYLGVVEGDDTDLVEVQGIAPVGQIMPFSGPTEKIPYGWLSCDGSRLEKGLWSELYGVIGHRYYKTGVVDGNYLAGNVPILLPYADDCGIIANDLLTVEATINGVFYSRNTRVVSVSGSTLTVQSFGFGNAPLAGVRLKVRGRVATTESEGTSIFFLPDFRTRTLIGSVDGLGGSFGGIAASLGDIGGATGVGIDSTNLPPHAHGLVDFQAMAGTDATVAVGSDQPFAPGQNDGYINNYTTASLYGTGYENPTPLSVVQPYATINWIIRGRKGLSALILSGHNHDDRYHPLNGDMNVTGGVNLDSSGRSVDGRWSARFSDKTLTDYPEFYRGDNTNNAILSVNWKADNRSHLSKSVGGVVAYGDFSVRNQGITATNTNGVGGIVDPIKSLAFDVNSKVSTATIYGTMVPYVTPKINLSMHDGGSNPYGRITGLTAPTSADYAANKWYADTAPKYINAALTLSDTSDIADGSSESQFAVIASAGVVNTGGKNVFVVSANQTPSWYGRSKTEAHVRGDLQVFGNGLTGSWGAVKFTGHSYSTFSVETLQSKVRLRGGGTYPTVGGTIWSPVLSFENRAYGINTTEAVSSAPIGRIEGLTAPKQHHEAANKWYVDNGRTNLLIATNSITGVAMFNATDFDVNSEGLVSITKPFDTLIITATGSYANPPVSSEISGVNIKTVQGLLGSGTPQYNVLSAIAVDKALGESVSRIDSTTDSSLEVFVNGDFTVFGDGIGNNSHTKLTFSVDPKRSSATIFGGVRNAGTNRTTPKLSLFQEDVPNAYNAGVIEGLTAPTQDHHAANKWYAERHNYINRNNYGTLSGQNLYAFADVGDPPSAYVMNVRVGGNLSTQKIDPGVYAINVTLRVSGNQDQTGNSVQINVGDVDSPSPIFAGSTNTLYDLTNASSDGSTQPYVTLNIIQRITSTGFWVGIENPYNTELDGDYSTIAFLSWARLGA